MRHSHLPLLLAFALLAACSNNEPAASDAAQPADSDPPATPAAPTTTAPPADTGDTGLQPISSRDRTAGGSSIIAQGAVFTLPAGWIAEAPSSSMRLAQARIPGAAGEGQLTVFYFGAGGGGGVEANIQRWLDQVDPDPDAEALRDTFDVGGFRVTWVDVAGTLKPSTMGTGPTTPQPGSRLLAGIIEGGQGPWYFKATGPAETLLAEREAFLGMLRSVEPHG